MDGTITKHTNQLEIAQNEIWTPQKFPTIWYSYCKWQKLGVEARERVHWLYAYTIHICTGLSHTQEIELREHFIMIRLN